MTDYKYYCPHCDLFLTVDDVWWDTPDPATQSPHCNYCNLPADHKPDPYDKGYDTLEEKEL